MNTSNLPPPPNDLPTYHVPPISIPAFEVLASGRPTKAEIASTMNGIALALSWIPLIGILSFISAIVGLIFAYQAAGESLRLPTDHMHKRHVNTAILLGILTLIIAGFINTVVLMVFFKFLQFCQNSNCAIG